MKIANREIGGDSMRKTIAERIFDKIKIGADDECWPWMGAKFLDGYGSIWFRGGNRRASRILCQILGHELLSDIAVLHRCDSPPCMNPRHLFFGTRADNCRDMGRKGRAEKGSKKWCAKLTETDIPKIRALRRQGLFYREIAKQFAVHPVTIGDIFRGSTWKHV